MKDEFDDLKKLGKQMAHVPTDQMIQNWAKTSVKQNVQPTKAANSIHWWSLAAALLVGIVIGKFFLQPSSPFSSTFAKINIEDETFEHIYTNN